MTTDPDELRRQAAALTAQAARLESSQLTATDIAAMKPDQIEAARAAGRLQVLMGTDPAEVALVDRARFDQIGMDDVRALAAINRHDLINDAHKAGRINSQGEPA